MVDEKRYRISTESIRALVKAELRNLRSKKHFDRTNAAYHLERYLGDYGEQASFALPAMRRCLADPDPNIRIPATRAMAYYHLRKKEWEQAGQLMRHRNREMALAAFGQLGCFCTPEYIERFAPLVLRYLRCRSVAVRIQAIRVVFSQVGALHWKTVDISYALPFIHRFVHDRSQEIAYQARHAFIEYYARQEGGWQKIGELLESLWQKRDVEGLHHPVDLCWAITRSEEHVRIWWPHVCRLEIWRAASPGNDPEFMGELMSGIRKRIQTECKTLEDLLLLERTVCEVEQEVEHPLKDFAMKLSNARGGRPAALQNMRAIQQWIDQRKPELAKKTASIVSILIRWLQDKDPACRFFASERLIGLARKGKGMAYALPVLVEALESRHSDARDTAVHLLLYGIWTCRSVKRLEEIQPRIEQAALTQSTVNPSSNPKVMETKIRWRNRITEVVAVLAERKAKLAKQKDGELLAGETIKPPQRPRAPGRGSLRFPRTIRL